MWGRVSDLSVLVSWDVRTLGALECGSRECSAAQERRASYLAHGIYVADWRSEHKQRWSYRVKRRTRDLDRPYAQPVLL